MRHQGISDLFSLSMTKLLFRIATYPLLELDQKTALKFKKEHVAISLCDNGRKMLGLSIHAPAVRDWNKNGFVTETRPWLVDLEHP